MGVFAWTDHPRSEELCDPGVIKSWETFEKIRKLDGREKLSQGEENTLFFTAYRGCLLCVAKVALMTDENPFLLSALSWSSCQEVGRFWGYWTLSLEVAAVGASDQKSGPSALLLPPMNTVSEGNGGLVVWQATPALCECGAAAPERERSAGAD